MKYVILRDEETDEIELIGRFEKHAVGEVWRDGRWKSDSTLYSDLFDGLLEEISEAEAEKLTAEKTQPQLQAA